MKAYTVLFDVGNTNIKICFADRHKLLTVFTLPSDRALTGDSLGLQLATLLAHQSMDKRDIGACVACSVVPALNPILRQACLRYLRSDLILVPEEMPIPLENHYTRPNEVGADRLMGAYAARQLKPDMPSIISVDYGTATTFDCISGNAYLGGLIAPGMASSLSALATKTAKLQNIGLEVDEKTPIVGRSTAVSINHGFVFGFAAMTDGLCRRLSENLEGPVAVIATGGFAPALARVVDCFSDVQPDLLLEGLRRLYYEQAG